MPDPQSSVIWPGQVYGRWTVVRFSHKHGAKWYWTCKCECGTEIPVYSASLRNGRSKSCGCLNIEIKRAMKTTHGMHRSDTYKTWESMIQRCHNPNHKEFHIYGGRGISVCQRWRDSFASFLEDMGERPTGAMSIDRFPDNDGDYRPGNCRWATMIEQNRNKRNNRLITHAGLTMTMMDWSERVGINFHTLRARMNNGWSSEDALTTPANRHNALRFKDQDRKAITLTFNGETATIAIWSRRTGIKPSTLIQRKWSGWSDERSLTTSVRPIKRSRTH